MKKSIRNSLLATCLAVVVSSFSFGAASAAPNYSLVGYANVNGTTTGGAGGTTVTVTNLTDFKTYASSSSKYIIKVNGNFSLSGQVDVKSNKTILGVGSNSGFTGGGLRVKGSSNVIIKNLKIAKAVGTDAISIDSSDHIWIDHNDLSSDLTHDKDYYDGLLDISHGSDYVTVSWNKFHDHYKGSLVGHSDNNSSEDTGHLKVTYHHNSFVNVNSRIPSLRFGTGHVYNNYIKNASTGAHSRMNAQMLVESNYFDTVSTPIQNNVDSSTDGYINEKK
ncbi:polysaccharide lyase family 1 protein [Paenibacillus sp. RC67]|uniref:pectate lyase family protein n=1 Tax=Paenibacillus sp. RC67 TaxID=3039392 RepID=UPI0024AC8500|nr:polysaccharide lyase family 1 protein [Paenibacillus sp. RC67]